MTRPAALPAALAWTLETREHRGDVYAGAFSPNGKLLATGGQDGTIRIRNAETGEVHKAWPAHAWNITALAWSPDGSLLASGDHFKLARIWEAGTGRLLREIRTGWGYGLHRLAWSPDGRQLAASIHPCTFWDVETGKQTGEWRWAGWVQWSPDGQTLAGVQDGDVLLRNARSCADIAHVRGQTRLDACGWSPDGKRLAAVDVQGRLRVSDIESATNVLGLGLQGGVHYGCLSQRLAWSPDGQRIAVACDGCLNVVNVDGKKAIYTQQLDSNDPAVAWSPDGRTIFTAAGTAICLRDAETGAPRFELDAAATKANAAWSATSDRLAIIAADGMLAADRLRPDLLKPLAGSATMFAWAPKGKCLATGSREGTGILLWDDPGNAPPRTVNATGELIGGLAWSPDATVLAGKAQDQKTVYLWEAGSGKELAALKADGLAISWVLWSPDSRRIASNNRPPRRRLAVGHRLGQAHRPGGDGRRHPPPAVVARQPEASFGSRRRHRRDVGL